MLIGLFHDLQLAKVKRSKFADSDCIIVSHDTDCLVIADS